MEKHRPKRAVFFRNSLPRGEGGPKGRVRNSGGNQKVSTPYQTSTRVAPKTMPRWRSSHFQNYYVTARIPHQSKIGSEEPIFDSFPPGEAFGQKTAPFSIEQTASDHREGFSSRRHPRVASLALRAIHLQVARRSRVGGVGPKSSEYVENNGHFQTSNLSTPQSPTATAPLKGSLELAFFDTKNAHLSVGVRSFL